MSIDSSYPTNQKKSWFESIQESAYSSISWAWTATIEKTQQVWARMPGSAAIQAYNPVAIGLHQWRQLSSPDRLGLEAAVHCLLPGRWLLQAVTAVLAVTEMPRAMIGWLRNEPVEVMGHTPPTISTLAYHARGALGWPAHPSPPKGNEPLETLKDRIKQFEDVSAGKPVLDPTAPAPTQQQLEASTNQKLKDLIKKISAYSTLYILCAHIGQMKEDNLHESMLNMADLASKVGTDGKQPSLWSLFYRQYGGKLSYPQLVQAALFYFFFHWIPIGPNTIDAYMKQILEVFRARLTKDSVSRLECIEYMVKMNGELLSVLNAATENFANGKPICMREGGAPLNGLSLSRYQEQAIKEFIGMSDEALSLRFIQDFIDQYPARVPFRFGEGLLNRIIPWVLKHWILPDLTLSLLQQGTGALTQPGAVNVIVSNQGEPTRIERRPQCYLPFVRALTETALNQMIKIHEQMSQEETSSQKKDLTHTVYLTHQKDLLQLIAHLIEAIHLSGPARVAGQPTEPDTIENVRLRIEKFRNKPKNALDAKIKEGIQEGLLDKTRFLVDYLADPMNAEAMFADLIDLLIRSFGELPTTPEEWKREIIKYENSKERLMVMGRKIVGTVIDASVEAAAGNTSPQKIEDLTKNVFTKHTQEGGSVFEQLSLEMREIRKKIDAFRIRWTSQNALQPHLVHLAKAIEQFKNWTEIEEDLKALPESEKIAIQQVLQPFYEGAIEIMDFTLALQQLESQYASISQNRDHLSAAKNDLSTLMKTLSLDNQDPARGQLANLLQNLQAASVQLKEGPCFERQTIDRLKTQCMAAVQLVQSILAEEAILNHLQEVRHWLNELVSGHSPKECVQEINKRVEKLGLQPSEKDWLCQQMEFILPFTKTRNVPSMLLTPLSSKLEELENSKKKMRQKMSASLNEQAVHFNQSLQENLSQLSEEKESRWASMQTQAAALGEKIEALHEAIQTCKKPEQQRVRYDDLRKGSTTLGAIAGWMASRAFSPFALSYLGAPAVMTPALSAILSMLQIRWAGSLGSSLFDKVSGMEEAKREARAQVTEIFEKGYDNVFTWPPFYTTNLREFMKYFVQSHHS